MQTSDRRQNVQTEVSAFTLAVHDFTELMKLRGYEACEHVRRQFGGVDKLCELLHVSPDEGLTGSPDDTEARIRAYGSNVIPKKPPSSFFKLVFEALQDTTLLILIAAAIVSIGLSFYKPPRDKSEDQKDVEHAAGWIDGTAILAAVAIVVLVSSINDWRKERQFRSLKAKIEQEHTFSVLRSGAVVHVQVAELVVGDICFVKYGDLVPADGVIIQSNDLKSDESSLTGESELVSKGVGIDPLVLSGTRIMEGSGKVVVVAVGINSQAGIIFALLGAADDVKKNGYFGNA